MTETDRRLGTAGTVLAAAFPVLLALLHVLNPGYDPGRRLISEYEGGNQGWLMRLAFFCLAGAAFAVSATLWPRLRTFGGRTGLVLLGVVGLALVQAGVFALGTPHLIAALVVIPGFPVAATVVAVALRRNRALSGTGPVLTLTALAWAGVVVFFVSPYLYASVTDVDPASILGYPNRLMMAAYAAWLAVVAWKARTAR